MNEVEKMMIEKERKLLELEQQKINMGSPQVAGQTLQLREQQRSWVHDQINLEEEMGMIEHLLRSEVLKRDKKTGATSWVQPTEKEQIVLSDYGVHMFMNTICFYLNKNTLLSNYDPETILYKMEDLSMALADVVFMESEKIFQTPSFEECKKVFEDRINKKTELRKFAFEIIGTENVNVNKIKAEFIKEIEHKIEEEFQKIKEQLMKNKYKRFELILRVVQDVIHSTYLRALYGAERRTLRQHSHFTESLGMLPTQQKIRSTLNPLNYFKRR